MTGPLGAGPFYRGKSRAIKVPPCGPALIGEPAPPASSGPQYYGKSRAIKAGFDVRSSGERPPVGQGTGPIYHGVSRAIKVRSCPVYVAGATYGPAFEGIPCLNDTQDSGYVTCLQGTHRTSWLVEPEQALPPTAFRSYSEVERLAADGEGVFVQFIEGNGVNFQDNWALAKYSPDGVLLWGPIRRPGDDSFDIKCQDGRVFTSFGNSLHPIMLDASTGDIIFEYDAGGSGYLSGASKGPGDTMYVIQIIGIPYVGYRIHRVGAGGIEASSALLNSGNGIGQWGGSGIDYHGGSHPDPNRFYNWRSLMPGENRFEEWQGYPTVEYIRTLITWNLTFGGPHGPDAITVDPETGYIFTHGEGSSPHFDGVNAYDPDGNLLWISSAQQIEDDATQMVAKNGNVYVAGFIDHPPGDPHDAEDPLPCLIILSQVDGSVVQPLQEWGYDSTETTDVYGLAAV